MSGFYTRDFRFDTELPTAPIQLQKNMKYRFLSRNPIDIIGRNFTFENISDEIIHVSQDVRVSLRWSFPLVILPAEYVSIIGYPYIINDNNQVGFKRVVSKYKVLITDDSPIIETLDESDFQGTKLRSFFLDQFDIIFRSKGNIVKFNDMLGPIYITDILGRDIFCFPPNRVISNTIVSTTPIIFPSAHYQFPDNQAILLPFGSSIQINYLNAGGQLTGIDYSIKARVF